MAGCRNARVTEDLRDVHRGQGDAGEGVADSAAAGGGGETAEERQIHPDNPILLRQRCQGVGPAKASSSSRRK